MKGWVDNWVRFGALACGTLREGVFKLPTYVGLRRVAMSENGKHTCIRNWVLTKPSYIFDINGKDRLSARNETRVIN